MSQIKEQEKNEREIRPAFEKKLNKAKKQILKENIPFE